VEERRGGKNSSLPKLLNITVLVYLPLPLSATLCELPALGALSVKTRLDDRLFLAVGVNVTLTEQVAPGFRLATQLFATMAKSPTLPPVIATLVIVTGEPPELVTRTDRGALVVFCVWFPNDNDVGFRVTAGISETPVPVSATVFAVRGAAGFTLSDAVFAPVVVGLNVTLTVQDVPVFRVLGKGPQVLV
jgi:hypothetical protein